MYVRPLQRVIVTGVVLGAGAVLADVADGVLSGALQIVFSSGVAWASGAAWVGSGFRGTRRAAVAGLVCLGLATGVYYAAILMFALRPGTGPLSVLRAAAIWGVIAAASGPACGWLGHVAVFGSSRARSLAWGALAGLLAAPGVAQLLRGWSYIFGPNARGVLTGTVIVIVVPVVAGGVAVARGAMLRWLTPAAALAGIVGAVGWASAESIVR